MEEETQILGETLSRILRLARHITGDFGDESFRQSLALVLTN